MENKEFLLIAAIFVSFIIFVSSTHFPETRIYIINQTQPISFYSNKSTTTEIYLPAVDEKGNGVITKLEVKALLGSGKVLVDINQLLFWIDTQYSIQTAKNVAEKITGKNLSKYDLIYSIQTNASLIEGPSAGAAITIATIAALENKTLNKSVMITGTIQPDGRIGPVGGILAKARAARSVGAELFLVPLGQGTQVNYIPIKKCRSFGYIKYCEITYEKSEVSISEDAGVEVKEVGTIEDAMKYFF